MIVFRALRIFFLGVRASAYYEQDMSMDTHIRYQAIIANSPCKTRQEYSWRNIIDCHTSMDASHACRSKVHMRFTLYWLV